MGKNKSNSAVKIFTEKISSSLKGGNAAQDIQKAVWDLVNEFKQNVPRIPEK